MLPATAELLTPRWLPMRMHPERRRLLTSPARHRVVAAGRRSGKTEDAKRIVVIGDEHHGGCLNPPDVPNPRFGVFAPTREQVKRIWWQDLKDLSPRWAVRAIREDELTIRFVNGAELRLIGLDRPQRAEGDPYDGVVLDECAELKPVAWDSSVRPTLDNRGRPPGWSLRIGRPKGRGHFYDWWKDAASRPDSAAFHWKSVVVLGEQVVAEARRDMDELTFRQEYEADWINFEGLAYHCYDPALHLRTLQYDPALPLVFCFDFNVDPGVAVILQEQMQVQPGGKEPFRSTCVLDEVFIRNSSNTPRVCRKLIEKWGTRHKGAVILHGDATGGRRWTSSEAGTSDWDQIEQYLRPAFSDLRKRVGASNPHERDRVNSFNTRLRTAGGDVRFYVDPQKAPEVVRDLEGVCLIPGSAGELDKDKDKMRSHLTDAIGYWIHHAYPLGGGRGYYE